MSLLGSTHHLPRPFRVLWELLPAPVVSLRAFRTLGALIYEHHTRHQDRAQSHSTWFMRNVPQLEVLCDLIARRAPGSIVTIASIGCSTGAELYSALALIRAARPDLDLRASGVDISAGVVEAARDGSYRTAASAAEAATFEGGFSEVADLSAEHRAMLFTEHAGLFRIQDWIRKGTTWMVADASNPPLAELLKPHDIVLANNLLGPMDDAAAENCLRNVLRVVKPGGHLVVDGVDLDVKSRVLPQAGFVPLCERIQEIYWADASKRGWPWVRWAREPLDMTRSDWQARYATIFRAPDARH